MSRSKVLWVLPALLATSALASACADATGPSSDQASYAVKRCETQGANNITCR